MKIHYLQHESFEDLASIFTWANTSDNSITSTKFFEAGYAFPLPDAFDILIVMGGAMGVYEEHLYPWLTPEKKFIEQALKHGKKVLGICLGAQLLAEVLGGKVFKNKEKEIGWFDVQFTTEAKKDSFFHDFPQMLKVFHWHSDTFDLPGGTTHIAQSEGCRNQAFTYNNDQAIGLQFHIEATRKSIDELVLHCKDELMIAPYIQSEKNILLNASNSDTVNKYMFRLLDRMKFQIIDSPDKPIRVSPL